MGDALWILSGRYDVSYAARKAGFATLASLGYPGFEVLASMYDQAAEYKLRPVESHAEASKLTLPANLHVNENREKSVPLLNPI